MRVHLVLLEGGDQIIKGRDGQAALCDGRLQRDEDRVPRELRLCEALMQHRAPLAQQTRRRRGICDLIAQIVRRSAERVHAVEVGPQTRRVRKKVATWKFS